MVTWENNANIEKVLLYYTLVDIVDNTMIVNQLKPVLEGIAVTMHESMCEREVPIEGP